MDVALLLTFKHHVYRYMHRPIYRTEIILFYDEELEYIFYKKLLTRFETGRILHDFGRAVIY